MMLNIDMVRLQYDSCSILSDGSHLLGIWNVEKKLILYPNLFKILTGKKYINDAATTAYNTLRQLYQTSVVHRSLLIGKYPLDQPIFYLSLIF